MDQPINQQIPPATIPEAPAKSSVAKIVTVAIFSSLITGLVVGLVVYFWQQKVIQKTQNNFEQQQLEAPQPTPIYTPLPSATPTNPTISEDTTTWKTLTNKHGWSIKYPSTWEASGVGLEVTADTAPGVNLQGPEPRTCLESDTGCGTIVIDSEPQGNAAVATTPQQLLLSQFIGAQRKILTQKTLTLNNAAAYEVTYLQTIEDRYPSDPIGQVFQDVAVNCKGKMYVLSLTEQHQDMSKINSGSDWQLRLLFDQILSTFACTT